MKTLKRLKQIYFTVLTVLLYKTCPSIQQISLFIHHPSYGSCSLMGFTNISNPNEHHSHRIEEPEKANISCKYYLFDKNLHFLIYKIYLLL